MRNYLVKLREEKNFSQQDVSKQIGISSQYYSMIEQGKRQPRMEITLAVKLSTLFEIPVQRIIELEQKYISETR